MDHDMKKLFAPLFLALAIPALAQSAPPQPLPASVLCATCQTLLAVTNQTGSVALPSANLAYNALTLYNVGAHDAYFAQGDNTVAATTANVRLPAGTQMTVWVSGTYVAAITASSTTTIYIYQSSGPLSFGAGGDGGAGGAVTMANGANVALGATGDTHTAGTALGFLSSLYSIFSGASGATVTPSANTATNISTNTDTEITATQFVGISVNTGGTTSTAAVYNKAATPCAGGALLNTFSTTAQVALTNLNETAPLGVCVTTAGAAAANVTILSR
jgi:hypothetical protein